MNETAVYDIAIIGGGPAGMTAAIYGARAGKKIVIFEKEIFGGKIVESPVVQNIPGFSAISGMDFGENMETQMCDLGVDEVFDGVDSVVQDENTGNMCLTTGSCQCFMAKTIIIATGTKNRVLHLPNEEDLIGNGISFCVACDGNFYKNRTVIVIGGGNSAITEAIELSNIAEKVIVLQDQPSITCEEYLADRLSRCQNVSATCNVAISGYITNSDGEFQGVLTNKGVCFADGVFLAIGLEPDNSLFKDIVELDCNGFIVVDNNQCASGSHPNIFACGDCTNHKLKQVVTACAEGAIAATSAIKFLNS